MEEICNILLQDLVLNALGHGLHTSLVWHSVLFCCQYCFPSFWAQHPVDLPLTGSRFVSNLPIPSRFCFFFTCLNSVLNKFVPPALAFCTHSIPTFPVFRFLPLFTCMWRDEPSLLIILLFPFQFCYFCQSWKASIRLFCIVFLKGCQVAWLVLKLQLYYNYYV